MAGEGLQCGTGADLDKLLDATKSVLQYDSTDSGRRRSVATSLEKKSSLLSSSEFDDSEFDVPAVTLPTLEDILADESEGIDPFDGDVLASAKPDPCPAVLPKKQKQSMPNNVHGSVLRHSRLKNLASQLHSASAKVSVCSLCFFSPTSCSCPVITV